MVLFRATARAATTKSQAAGTASVLLVRPVPVRCGADCVRQERLDLITTYPHVLSLTHRSTWIYTPHSVPETGPTSSALSAELRREGAVRHFPRGQALFVEGDRSDRVFMIERGSVLVFCTAPAGRDVVLAVRGPGDVLGDLSALDDLPRMATAVALDDVDAVVAPRLTLVRALQQVETAQELIQTLADRLREADRRRLEFATQDTLGRVAARLLELAENFGSSSAEGVIVELRLSQDQLASWCGASREATVKALRTLRSLGCIATARRRVVVRDLEALRRHATGLA